MNIAFLAIGTELLDGLVLENNSNWVGNALATLGLSLSEKLCVRDEAPNILEALGYLSAKSDGIIITGGLGPTEDDKTRECVASFVQKPLIKDPQLLSDLAAKFKAMRLTMPIANEKQAMVIEGSIVINNPRGTAPGFILAGQPWIASFPGVPSELEGMFAQLLDFLKQKDLPKRQKTSIYIRTLGLSESFLDEQMKKLQYPGIQVGTIARFGQVDIRLDVPVEKEEEALDIVQNELGRFPDILLKTFSLDSNLGIEQSLIEQLIQQKKTLILAESCTGGLIAKRLTDVPGSSQVLLGSLVTYENALKVQLLGVQEDTLRQFGAVSAETAFEMVKGLQHRFQADYAIAVTGIAGPSGGSVEKPVGTVFIGFGTVQEIAVMRFQLSSERERNRERTAMKVFELLWDHLSDGNQDYSQYASLAGVWYKNKENPND